MTADPAEEKQPWVSCFLTDILLSYVEETTRGKTAIDYGSLFRAAEGFEPPGDPEAFLRDITTWVPLTILRELHWQCERISGKKDIAYHAAKAYFDPGKKDLLSLFKILFRVLNDVRSVLVCSNLWAAVQTNYLKLQSFEKPGPQPGLYMLAQFGEHARPTVGSMHFLRGLCEGSPRLYGVDDVRCLEEISQLQIADVVHEFPEYTVATDGDRLEIRHGTGRQPVVEAKWIPLRDEVVPLSPDFWVDLPDTVVVPPRDNQIQVSTPAEETDPLRRRASAWGYRIVTPGALSSGSLSYAFHEGQVLNAPYTRLRFLWDEGAAGLNEASVEQVRREVSQLLFEHLKQTRHARTRMIQYSIEKRDLTLENIRLRQEIEREYSVAGIVGQSPKMRELFGVIRSIAETDVVALIRGETGTGKELIARAIHYNSPRRAKRFVAVNCGALAETLLESELFGHEKGAFTGAVTRRRGIFEVADGGTLFLDEVGEVSPSTQVRLLRVLQDGEFQRVGGSEAIRVDVRILSATNQNLEDLVKQGRFRQDLYYRLNVFPIRIPPLRERPDDIPLLISHFAEKHARKMNRRITGVEPRTMARLMTHAWPGNVRELENVVQRMMVVSKSDTLDLDALPPEIRGDAKDGTGKAKDLKDLARESAEVVEKRAIQDALATSEGNVTRAAQALGISRATLQKRMKSYGLRGSRE
ncbi:MAG TPA: sigma-54 dependent transcriptional regulator [Candidatus Methylomirabilis sp.]|nr:sigma-54 dependent transcriptional regulator [Candidatus Methylomirabilis sp.]